MDIFLVFAKNIDCGYTLEPPRPLGEPVLTSTHNECFGPVLILKVSSATSSSCRVERSIYSPDQIFFSSVQQWHVTEYGRRRIHCHYLWTLAHCRTTIADLTHRPFLLKYLKFHWVALAQVSSGFPCFAVCLSI